ncbi:MAG: UDP-N-acetylglucosamine diphosphorylase [Puniceicoccales bacterium]|jgi:NDP-sugar pyrophosphorylase family protein|nr:UDP-N-acetylglucosamine diphosphorylase [Puniceicoccales bacterium]
MSMRASDFFRFPKSLKAFSYFFSDESYPWTWLPNIEKALLAYESFKPRNSFLKSVKKLFSRASAIQIGDSVYLGENVKLPAVCTIGDRVYIGDGTEIRSGALIRGNVIIGKNCVIGNGCEIKNSLLMDHVQVAHFNYVGDSILGSHVHLAAGAILSNLRFDKREIAVKVGEEKIPTGLKKLGAILGERVQIGCNAVLLPGSLVGRDSIVSVGTVFGGVLAEQKIVRSDAKNIIIDRKYV